MNQTCKNWNRSFEKVAGSAALLLSVMFFTSTEAEVAGEGVAVGVQGEGGPGVLQPFPTNPNFHSGLSLITWVASFPRNSSNC